MSLVVLRSWSDGAPKVRAIAPPDSTDDFVYVPDHKGQFVAQEVTKKPQKVKHGVIVTDGGRTENVESTDQDREDNNRDSRRNSRCSTTTNSRNENVIVKEQRENDTNKNHNHSNQVNNGSRNNSTAISGNKSNDGRYSTGANIVTVQLQQHQSVNSQSQKNRRFNEVRNPVLNAKLDRLVLRSTSTSPESADYIQELDSTPPSSPLSGRYRNLGPELAACIPKRQLKFGSNWMKDDPSNIGIRWSHRRNLSNSTPSLSQDFYSSEEEKISSFSSQSSSKAPSPQPPSSSASSSSSSQNSEFRSQRTHRQHPTSQPQQQQQQQQQKPNQIFETLSKNELAVALKKRSMTIDHDVPSVGRETPASLRSSASPVSEEDVEVPSFKFQQQKSKASNLHHLDGRPPTTNQSSSRGHRRPRQRQLLSSPSTPPPPPPDQHDFYRMVLPGTADSTGDHHSSCAVIECVNNTDIDQDRDVYNYNFSYLSSIKRQFTPSSSSKDEIIGGQRNKVSTTPTTPQQNLKGKSDVILVEVIRKQLKPSSADSDKNVSRKTSPNSSPENGKITGREITVNTTDLIGGSAHTVDFHQSKSKITKTTSSPCADHEHIENTANINGCLKHRVNQTEECRCDSNEKLCDVAVPQSEKIYLTSTPQQIEQGKFPLIKTSTVDVDAKIEESFQENIHEDPTPPAPAPASSKSHNNNNNKICSKAREILNGKVNPVCIEDREQLTAATTVGAVTGPTCNLEGDSDQREESTCSYRNPKKQASENSESESPLYKHQEKSPKSLSAQKEDSEAGNSTLPSPPVEIAPGSSAQCAEPSDSNSNRKPQLEPPHSCLSTSYLNLDLVEWKENESERTSPTDCHSSFGSIDRGRPDQDVPINLQQVNLQRSSQEEEEKEKEVTASPSPPLLKTFERNQDTSWSHLIVNWSETIESRHAICSQHRQPESESEATASHASTKIEGNPTCEPVVVASSIHLVDCVVTESRTEVSEIDREDTSLEVDVNSKSVKVDDKVLKLNLEANPVILTQTQKEQDKIQEVGVKEINSNIFEDHPSSESNSDTTETPSWPAQPKSNLSPTEELIIMDRGKMFEGASPIASVKIPVQAVNKHVRSDSGDELDPDVIWRNSAVRESFRGFCQELLESSSNGSSQDTSTNNSPHIHESYSEKIVIHVPQPQSQPQSLLPSQGINEGVIEFEEDEEAEDDDDRCSSDLSSSDASDNHPIQQCNNSIEYISVRDNIQVHGAVSRTECNSRNKGKNVNSDHYNIHPKPINWIISLDLGSRASGFSYWYHGEPNVVHIGSWSGDNCFHKIPSWILTSSDSSSGDKTSVSGEKLTPAITSSVSIKVGQEAFDEYTEKRGQSSSSLTFVNQWREFFELDSDAARMLTFPYTLESVDDMNFSQIVTAFIYFFGRAALSQIEAKFGSTFDKSEPIEWLITVPTCWKTQSRQCMREAAYKSGAVKANDGVNLIEDPMASSFFAAMCGEYENFLAVDVGGSFLHYSGFELQNGSLHQTVEARSLPLPTPELTFENILTQIVSQEFMLYYKAKYRPGWIELMKNFEKAKCKFDNSCYMPHSSAFVFLPSSFVIEFHGYTGMELSECILEQNTGLIWNDNGALCIPQIEMKSIFQSTLDFVVNKIDAVLSQHVFENLVLTGGLARCKFLKESVSERFPELKLIMPKEFPNGVLQGATLSLMPNIQPKLVIKSPFSIGVGVMTPFDPELHPEEKKIIKDGKTWCADAWDTLIKFSQEMELNSVINKRSYVGAQPGQSCLVLPLFKSCHSSIPKLVTDKSVSKCCELRFESTKTWQEIDLILTCRASELIVMAVDRENVVHRVVIDFM